ncbi:MAG: hypothetical protein WCC39_15760 [Telluria sp.]
MNATRRKLIFTGGLSAMLTLLVLHYVPGAEHPSTMPAVRVDASAPKVAKQAGTEGLQWMGALPTPAAGQQKHLPTFGEEVAALTATRKPQDALQAYGIIEGCEAMRYLFEMDGMPPAFLPRKKQCATITDGMRRSMYDYLRAAAFAASPGVGSPWFRYGPSGDKDALKTRPNDPAVIEWKQNALALVTRDADAGDINAMQDLMNGYAGRSPGFDVDPGQALVYATAYRDIMTAMDIGPVFNMPDTELDALAQKLSPEQLAWAKAKVKAIMAARAINARAGIR